MKSLTLSTACFLTLGALSLQAQFVVWDANLTTGVPRFSPAGISDTVTFDGGPNGKGAEARAGGEPYRFMYVPVTAPQGSVFACIGLRAHDTSAANWVTAEFFRQPRVVAGPAQSLGLVTTNNSGFQYVDAAFAAVPINYPLFTYYVRIKFRHGEVASILRGFDVSLLTACTAGGH